jgi:hypothetical protein
MSEDQATSEDKTTAADENPSEIDHASSKSHSLAEGSNPVARSALGDEPSKTQSATPGTQSFEELARRSEPSLAAELFDFLAHNKKWWLAPILIMLALFGILIALSTTSVAPFLYTLF